VTAPLGVLLAGGASTRYGAPKALAEVAGMRIADRALGALRDVVPEPVVGIANDPALGAALDVPTRPDRVPGLGPLGGIQTALHWALEEGRTGALCVSCDMPFLSHDLLRRIVDLAGRGAWDVVAPESGGPRGIEPLHAWYGPRSLPAVEAALARDDRRVVAFHGDVRVHRMPLAEVRRYGDPDVLFMNVNTPADRERAEAMARGEEAPP
jgi:molybdopterin-guanine dinucleotide biosynthesis protein A